MKYKFKNSMGIKSDYRMTKTSLIIFKTYIFYPTKVYNVQNDSPSMLTLIFSFSK